MEPKNIQEGLTFDDVLLVPQFSTVTPDRADTATRLTRNIRLNIPLISAPMDTVTEAALAIALAQDGGIGVIHKNLTPEDQAREVAKVKRSENGIITDPITLSPEDSIARARTLMDAQNVSGFPVTVDGQRRGKVVGILTRRDMKFLDRPEGRVLDVMTREPLVTAPPSTTLEEAEEILSRAKVEKLLLVNAQGSLAGLITMRDIENTRTHSNACRDARGRLRVGAAIGVNQLDRADALIEAEVDVIVVDTAHGHSENVLMTVGAMRRRYDIDIIAGNVATTEAARDLIDAGVDAVKVGIGPGSICTTRVVSGVGVPQLTAIANACRAADERDVPVIADGGVRHSGDIAKAIAMGASSVMLGSLFAGLDESPGEVIIHGGRRYKTYRGMGSQGAMGAGSADRYGQAGITQTQKYVPEGRRGPRALPRQPGRLRLPDGRRAEGRRWATAAARRSKRCADHQHFVRVSSAGLVESHPHDIQITKESPNYSSVQGLTWTAEGTLSPWERAG